MNESISLDDAAERWSESGDESDRRNLEQAVRDAHAAGCPRRELAIRSRLTRTELNRILR